MFVGQINQDFSNKNTAKNNSTLYWLMLLKIDVKSRRDTENIDPKMIRTKNNRLIMQSKCPICGIKKPRFVKE